MSFGTMSSFNAFGQLGTTAVGLDSPTASLWQPAPGWSPLAAQPTIPGMPVSSADTTQTEVTVGDGYYTSAGFGPSRNTYVRHPGRQPRTPSTAVAAQTQQRRSLMPMVIGGVALIVGAVWLLKPSGRHA